MIILLEDKHKEDLQFIKEQPTEVIAEFVRISIEFLRRGANVKLYSGASKSLRVPVAQVEAVVEGLSWLFAEASRLLVNEEDFLATLTILGFSPELNAQITELYISHRSEIRTIQSQLSFDLPHYKDLNWRFDVQLSSRSLRNQVTPLFTLCFNIEDNGETKKYYVESDYTNLKHLADELDNALRETKSTHSRRIMRNIK
ncbi:COMM domain-containing protein 2 isoform 2 [Planoprotostelium fungivorum]|uniref:COMM domain-containing protein 2 isoform 2 n=1 Tax=Planoprotostelium fungivorum TaxID=1890364 RepID=A0A2P6N5C9_9EUKA|nr:COMM domain-containing protein 2 isoform 2 [Planoprotostelium fungivorum]